VSDTVKVHLREHLERDARFLSNLVRMQQAVKDLGIDDLEAYVTITSYAFGDDLPEIIIHPLHTPGIGIFGGGLEEIALKVVDTTPLMSQIARKMLPVVGRLEKGFDAERNEVSLTAVYLGIRIVIKDETPKTCSVERVEEEIDVPEKIVPAHKEKKVTYKLVGDCDPLLADEAAHVVTSQGAIELPAEESL
jgi:hypothetical protein